MHEDFYVIRFRGSEEPLLGAASMGVSDMREPCIGVREDGEEGRC